MMATTNRIESTVKLVRHAPVASRLVGLDALAREAGLHPEVVRGFVRLGLVEPIGGTSRELLFPPAAAARLARAARLRRDLGLDYAGAVLASELLARIDHLERSLRRYELPPPPVRR
jgi:MerR HTH family regulatory protein